MRTSRLNQAYSVLTDPLLVATDELYFSKSTGRNEADVLADKVIVPNNLRGTPGKRQHEKHFSGATKELSLLFVAAFVLFPSVGLVNLTPQTRQNMRLFKRLLLETLLSVRS